MAKLFGLDIYTKGKESLLSDILVKNEKVHIISGNAEVLKRPLKDNKLFEEFTIKHSIIIPDGISVSIPLKVKQRINVERIAGIDLMTSILKKYEDEEKSVFLLGAKHSVIFKTVENISKIHPNLNIAGYHHGYINIHDCNDIIEMIKASKAEALFVAMGTPNQEAFIIKYMDELPCKVYMGVGGSFDVLSGNVSRAPKWISKIGMEWLYRMAKDPSKIKRLGNNLIFTIKGVVKG